MSFERRVGLFGCPGDPLVDWPQPGDGLVHRGVQPIFIPARLGLDRGVDVQMRRHSADRRPKQSLFSGIEQGDGLGRSATELPARIETALGLDQHPTPKVGVDLGKEKTPLADYVLDDVVARGAGSLWSSCRSWCGTSTSPRGRGRWRKGR
jgi:hypothetical protein